MLIETDLARGTRATFAPAPAAAEWSPSPYVLVRVAGKPYAELERLKFAATVPLFARIIAGRAAVAAQRAALSDELFALIGRHAGDQRSRLVALRRDLFNQRPLSADQRRLLRELPRPLAAQILGLIRQERRLARLTARARAVFAAELAEKRALLQQSCRDEEFQKGLQVASQSVYEGLRKYLRADPAALRGRERRIEGGLFKYLMRMTAKTSPFSRFGPTALAAYNPQAGRALSVRAEQPALVARTELRLSVISALADAVGLHPEVSPGLRPIVNPSAYESGSSLVLTRPYTPILRPGSGSSQRRGAYPVAVRQLVEFVRRHPDLTLRELPAAYAAAAGLPLPTVEGLVAKLLDAGLLLNELRLPSDAPDRLASLRAALATIDHPVGAATASASLTLDEQVRAFGSAGAAERQGLLGAIKDQLGGLLAGQPLSQRVRADFNNLIVEDVGLTGVAIELGPNFFAPFIDELSALFECVFARDQGGLGYASLRDNFVAAYGPGGRCASLPQLVELLSQVAASSLQSAFASGNFIPTDDERPRVKATNGRLLTYLESLNRLIAASAGQPEARVPADLLRQLAALFGGVAGPASAALHLQVAAPDGAAIERGEHLVVLNYTLAGFGHFYTRYCDLFAGSGLDEQIQARIAALAATLPPGSEAAEVLSVLENNAQLHPPLTRRQIVPSNERSARPAADQIAPEQLELVHNVASDDLHLLVRDDDGAHRLSPIYMGFFHPASVPLHHRLLVDLSPTGYLPDGLRPSEFLPAALPGTLGRANLPAAIERHPRVRIGNFVLQRELWTVPVACAPAAGSGADDFEFFLERYAWAGAQGLPREVFVRGKRHFKAGAVMGNVADVNKPLLLDIENFFAWKMIDQLLEDEDLHTLFVEEMLPNPRQMFFQLDDQPYAAEFQIEFNREETPND